MKCFRPSITQPLSFNVMFRTIYTCLSYAVYEVWLPETDVNISYYKFISEKITRALRKARRNSEVKYNYNMYAKKQQKFYT